MEHEAKRQLKSESTASTAAQQGTADLRAPIDSTVRVDEPSCAETLGADGRECLQLMEAIRLTAPEYLDDILTADRQRAEADGHQTGVASETPLAIGRFRIIRPLGRGGHAVVFLAEDPSLRRQVALKVPRPETLMTESLRRRFVREAEAVAALNHPNIVPVYETGTAGPVCYIAAAYCSGKSLADWISAQEGPIATRPAAEIVAVLADAVQHAHARGILHRDIKPANVLFDETPAPADGRHQLSAAVDGRPWAVPESHGFDRVLRLADFGLARVGEVATADSLANDVLGTPSYMAPEQASGQADLVTTATDVYGLGATLYHLLAGRPPFQGQTQIATILAVREQDPHPPSEYVSGIPRDLDAICLKCLEKDPAGRYATAAELRDDLRRHLEHKPVHARPVGRAARVARWCRRRPALTALSVLLLLSVVVGAGNVVWQWSRAERHLATSQRERQRAVDNLHGARQAVDELLTEVASELEDTPQMQALRRNLLLKAAEINEQLLQNDQASGEFQLESIRAWRRAADLFAELGNPLEVGHALENGLRLASTSAQPAARAERAALYRQRGELQYSQQSYAAALEDYEQSVQLWAHVLAQSDTAIYRANAAETVRLMGTTMVRLGDYQQAEIYFEDAVARLQGLTDEPGGPARVSLLRSHALRSLGKHYQSTGRHQAALTEFDFAATELERVIESAPLATRYRQRLAELRVDTGFLLITLNRYPAAGTVFDSTSESMRRLADDFPLSPSIKLWLAKSQMGQAVVLHRSDQLDASADLQHEATTILTEIVDRFESPHLKHELSNAYGLLGKLRRLRGDFEGAERAVYRAVTIAEELVSTQSPTCSNRKTLAQALFDLACLQLGQKDSLAAAESCHQSVDQRQLVLSINPTDYTNRTQLVKTILILSSAESSLGQFREAADHITTLAELAPHYFFGRSAGAIAWLQLAERLEQAQQDGSLGGDLTVEGCRRRAIDALNQAAELDSFHLPALTRMEIFGELLRVSEYRDQLAEVYQSIDLDTLPPPRTSSDNAAATD